jgi:SET domain-containing protein
MTATLPFEIRESAVSGKGAFATRAIAARERVIEYVGERITHEEADRRYDDESMDVHHTFLFTVSSRTVIDASHGGNEARFINHSCAPNCEAEIERGRVFIYALRDIAPGGELCYDYAYQRSGDETEADEELYRCLCGAPECRGSIMEPVAELEKRVRKPAPRPEASRAQRQRQRA